MASPALLARRSIGGIGESSVFSTYMRKTQNILASCLHPSSFILHLSSFIFHPSSFITALFKIRGKQVAHIFERFFYGKRERLCKYIKDYQGVQGHILVADSS